MKTSRKFDSAGFMADLEREGLADKLNEIGAMIDLADKNERWSKEFMDKAIGIAKRKLIREVARRGMVDEFGVKHEFLCIKELNKKKEVVEQGYKQVMMFTAENFEWVINDKLSRIDVERSEIDRLLRLCAIQCGKPEARRIRRSIQKRLSLIFEPVAV
jgi:hypothetical protein